MDATKTTVSLAEFRANIDFYLQQAQTQPITIAGQQDIIFMNTAIYEAAQLSPTPVVIEPEQEDISELITQRVLAHKSTHQKLASR